MRTLSSTLNLQARSRDVGFSALRRLQLSLGRACFASPPAAAAALPAFRLPILGRFCPGDGPPSTPACTCGVAGGADLFRDGDDLVALLSAGLT